LQSIFDFRRDILAKKFGMLQSKKIITYD
jgi:hypothetical protein